MEFKDTTEIPRSTCESCSQILVASIASDESNGGGKKAIFSGERLALLLSEAGLDVRISQSVFCKAVESGCTIRNALRKNVVRYNSDGRLSKFCLGDFSTDLEAGHDSGDEQAAQVYVDNYTDGVNDDLVLNFHADTFAIPDGTTGEEREQGRTPSSYDIRELQDSPLGAHERWNSSVSFDTFALSSGSPCIEQYFISLDLADIDCQLPSEAHPASKYITTRPVNPEMGTDTSVEVVNGWIRQCTQSHGKCPAPQSIPRLPTRVIDVEKMLEGQEPRLVITQGQFGQYACLSYCWGGP